MDIETLTNTLSQCQNTLENLIETNSQSSKECFFQNTHLIKAYTSIRDELDIEKQTNENLKKKNSELKEEYSISDREKEEYIFHLKNELKEIKNEKKELEILCEHLQKNIEILKMCQTNSPRKNIDNINNERKQNPLRNITNEGKSFNKFDPNNQNDLVKINNILQENHDSSNQIAKHLINDLDLIFQKFSFNDNNLSSQAMETATKNKVF